MPNYLTPFMSNYDNNVMKTYLICILGGLYINGVMIPGSESVYDAQDAQSFLYEMFVK